MRKKTGIVALIISLAMLLGVAVGCNKNATEQVEINNPADVVSVASGENLIDISLEMVPLTESVPMFTISMPVASGVNVKENEKALIDYSNTKDGYIMVKYLQQTDKALKVIVKGPSISYTYNLKSNGDYEVYPLSDGNGSYTIGVYEQVDGNKYATALTATESVSLNDEFAPFIRPNQYVNYNSNSETVRKAAQLVNKSDDLLNQIASVYNYVIANITYDKELAATVQSGYLPNLDAVLSSGQGICFDYAAVTTAMLRSQGIPTKLVVGYTGGVYHSWINVYSEETGWIDNVIYFDGENWKLMDPTFASSGGQDSEVIKYIGDGSNYTTKYLY